MGQRKDTFLDRVRERMLLLLDEEESDLYILTLHYQNHEDLNFFSGSDQVRVRKIFNILIRDTQKHRGMLESMLELMSKTKQARAR